MYRVLLVDDEPLVLNTLSAILPWGALECRLVGTALNGMDAYNKICDDYPDIVITDIKMPVLNGLELIEKAKKLDVKIDFIVLSGYDDFAFAQTAIKYGVKDYHLKPVRKEALCETLKSIVAERKQKDLELRLQEQQFLQKIKLPLQKSFLYDALCSPRLSPETASRYAKLLGFPQKNVTCCIISFLEPDFLMRFREDLLLFAKKNLIPILWPAFYVTNSLVFLYSSNLRAKDLLQEWIVARRYAGQRVELEDRFLHFENIAEAFQEIIRKISRYHTIRLLNEMQEPEDIVNSPLTAPTLPAEDCRAISSEYDVSRLVQETFSHVEDTETAILLCIRLLFSSPLFAKKEALDSHAIQFLLRSANVAEVQNIALSLLLGKLPAPYGKNAPPKAALIPRVKEYVDAHLDAENLSLKWLAENRFFISVGYLSKQFLAEEGEHFSHYLTKQRMELAKKLLTAYKGSNIWEVAEQVGFRNNPRYFSQVFKKYTGMTPSEFLADK